MKTIKLTNKQVKFLINELSIGYMKANNFRKTLTEAATIDIVEWNIKKYEEILSKLEKLK